MAGIMDKLQKLWNPEDDDYYYDEDEFEGEEIESYSSSQRRKSHRNEDASQATSQRTRTQSNSNQNGRVVSVNSKTQLDVVIYKPTNFTSETNEIANNLLQKNAVVLNLEKTDRIESRRILDFLSGVAFAQNGTVKRIATSTYMITPYTVGVQGEEIYDDMDSGNYF